MIALQQTIEVPADHWLTLRVPEEIPVGPVTITFVAPQAKEPLGMSESEWAEHKADCPLYAESPPFNDETLAALAEGDAMTRGEIPANRFRTLEELFDALDR
jgi:hypothetical protein